MANCGKAMARSGKLRQVLASSGNVCQILLKFVKKTAYVRACARIATKEPRLFTVASETEDQMSETIIKNRNLPNPHLFKPFFCTRTCHHPSSMLLYRHRLFFEAI